MQSGTRPQIDHPVGRPYGLLVVLHHQDRVAQIPHSLQGGNQPGVVPLVQADGRLVQDIEDSHELAADLGRQPDALAFAARQRCRGPIETQIAHPDVVEKLQPIANLLHDLLSNRLLTLAELQVGQQLPNLRDGHT